MSDRMNGKNFVIGAVIGGVVGATVALLFTPKSGRELRSDLNEGAMQVMDRANHLKQTAETKGAQWYEKGTELTKKAIDSTSQLTQDIVKKTDDMSDKFQQKMDENELIESEPVDQNEPDSS